MSCLNVINKNNHTLIIIILLIEIRNKADWDRQELKLHGSSIV